MYLQYGLGRVSLNLEVPRVKDDLTGLYADVQLLHSNGREIRFCGPYPTQTLILNFEDVLN